MEILCAMECYERRHSRREPNGWQESNGWQCAWKCDMHGHHLLIYQPNSGGRHWYKWIDGHFRGTVETMKLARLQLEREASGEGEAWGAK